MQNGELKLIFHFTSMAKHTPKDIGTCSEVYCTSSD